MTIEATTPRNPRFAYRSAITEFGVPQWIMVILSALWAGYLGLNTALWLLNPQFDYDYFLIINGGLFLFIVSWGSLIWRRVSELFNALWAAGNALFESPQVRDQEIGRVRRTFRNISLGITGAVTAAVLVGNLGYYGLLSGAHLDFKNNAIIQANGSQFGETYYFLTLVFILLLASGFAGYILGQMIGIGWVQQMLQRKEYNLAGFNSDGGSRTLRKFESIFELSILCTTSIGLIGSGWWAIWKFTPLADGYNNYLLLFIGLGTVGYVCFVFAGYLPVLFFNNRLNRLYGGKQARALTTRQITMTNEDLAENERQQRQEGLSDDDRERLEDQERDLRAYIASLHNREFNRPLLQSVVLHALLAFNTVVMIVPWISVLFFPIVDSPVAAQLLKAAAN